MKKTATILMVFLALTALTTIGNMPNVQAYTGTITYDSGTNTLQCYGGSGSTPIGFEDLYQADIANGWNVFHKQSDTQYSMDSHLTIGYWGYHGNTYFNDTCKQITFNDDIITGSGTNIINFDVRDWEGYHTYVQFGEVIDYNTKSTKNGCSFIDLNSLGGAYWRLNSDIGKSLPWGDCNFYSCSFLGINDQERIIFGSNVWNCVFGVGTELNCNYAPNVFNCIFSNPVYAIRRPNGNVTIDRISIFNSAYQVYWQDSGCTISNLYSRNSGPFRLESVIQDCFLVDVDTDRWTFSFSGTATKVYRQYTFDLNVLNGDISDVVEAANVTLSKNGVILGNWLTNSSGQVPTQTVTYGYYDQAHGNEVQEGEYPFMLTIIHPDWANYTSRFYVTEKTNLIVSMQEAPAPPSPIYVDMQGNNATFYYILVVVGAGAIIIILLWRKKH